MPNSRPSPPRQSGNGPARKKTRPAGRTPRPSSGQNPTAKSTKPATPGSPKRSGKPTDSHVSSYSVGSPLNRQTGFFQSAGIRLIVLGLVLAICVFMVLPVARSYFHQRSAISDLEQDLAVREELNENLANQLDRWEDDNYVKAQARERLTFVFPGEHPYRVMDADKLEPPEPTETAPQLKPEMQEPWFTTMWDSIQQAGNIGTEDSTTKNSGAEDSDTENPDAEKSGDTEPGSPETGSEGAGSD